MDIISKLFNLFLKSEQQITFFLLKKTTKTFKAKGQRTLNLNSTALSYIQLHNLI